METDKKYLCMDCEHYMKCPVNAGILCEFVKDYELTYIERKRKNHILVFDCDKYVDNERNHYPELPLPRIKARNCRVCGKPFDITKHNKSVCGDPKCKYVSATYRPSRPRPIKRRSGEWIKN